MSEDLIPKPAHKPEPSNTTTTAPAGTPSASAPEAPLLTPIQPADLNAIHQVASLVPSLRVFIGMSIAALIIIGLYFGRELLIPLALATLLGFLLNPLVSWLKNKGLPRLMSILLVISVALGILFAGAVYLGMQLGTLSQELPTYQNTIRSKLQNLKTYSEGPSVWDGAISTFTVVKQTLANDKTAAPSHSTNLPDATKSSTSKSTDKKAASAADADAEEAAIPEVRVVSNEPGPIDEVTTWLLAVASPITTAGIVLLFVILILLDRSDLRDRILRLLGSNLNTATDTLDEAAMRIGTYLRMELIVNLSYGVPWPWACG